MCGLCSAFLFTHQETVSSVRDSAQGKGRGRRPSTFSFPGSNLFSSSRLVSTGRRPTLRTYARNALPCARLPPAHAHTPPAPSALSIPNSQNNNPLHPFHFDNVTSTQPHQINHKPAAGPVSDTHPSIIITIAALAATPRHELQRR